MYMLRELNKLRLLLYIIIQPIFNQTIIFFHKMKNILPCIFINYIKFQLTIVLLLLMVFGCTNNVEKKEEHEKKEVDFFVLEDDSIKIEQPSSLLNLDLKNGFKNLKLGSDFSQYNFKKRWKTYTDAEKFGKIIVVNDERFRINKAEIKEIQLLFLHQKLVGILLRKIQPSYNTNRGDGLFNVLVGLYGEPNKHKLSHVGIDSMSRHLHLGIFKVNFRKFTDKQIKENKKTLRKISAGIIEDVEEDNLGMLWGMSAEMSRYAEWGTQKVRLTYVYEEKHWQNPVYLSGDMTSERMHSTYNEVLFFYDPNVDIDYHLKKINKAILDSLDALQHSKVLNGIEKL